MQAYWNRPNDTREVLDRNGWLRTGDCGKVRNGRLYIRGRLDQMLVTSRGENLSAADLESTLMLDPLFDQAMVVGDGRPFLAAVLVLNPAAWQTLAVGLGLALESEASLRASEAIDAILARMAGLLREFPSYAQLRAVHLTLEPWTTENDLLTSTLKLKRSRLQQKFATEIAALYRGRVVPE